MLRKPERQENGKNDEMKCRKHCRRNNPKICSLNRNDHKDQMYD